jgi:hypothetical protein
MWWISRFINCFNKEKLWIYLRFYQLLLIELSPPQRRPKEKQDGGYPVVINESNKREYVLSSSIHQSNLKEDIHELIIK